MRITNDASSHPYIFDEHSSSSLHHAVSSASTAHSQLNALMSHDLHSLPHVEGVGHGVGHTLHALEAVSALEHLDDKIEAGRAAGHSEAQSYTCSLLSTATYLAVNASASAAVEAAGASIVGFGMAAANPPVVAFGLETMADGLTSAEEAARDAERAIDEFCNNNW